MLNVIVYGVPFESKFDISSIFIRKIEQSIFSKTIVDI